MPRSFVLPVRPAARLLTRVGTLAAIGALVAGACSMHRRHSPNALVYGDTPTRSLHTESNTESYDRLVESPFLSALANPLSTFSIDVDTASYANVRRFVTDGLRPPPDAVRIEELVNYFRYDDPEPEGTAPIAIRTEVGPCPWQPAHELVRIGLRARSLQPGKTPPRNLTFLIDVSGSMAEPRKLPLLKRGLALLVDQLEERDRVAIVVYAGASGLVLPPTAGANRGRIRAALSELEAGGSTNGGAGIELAYRVAEEGFAPGGINRVILATDGDFNVGVSSRGALERLIEKKRESGVFLTVLGFGQGNLKDSQMEALADKGNGNYAYIDTIAEARKVLVEEAAGTLVTVAKDVKVQVELNPAEVARYRLVGYENRLLRKEDFEDDLIDAGDMGAGHTVTALYEIERVEGAPRRKAAALRYQVDAELAPAAGTGELMTVKIRYKEPAGGESRLLTTAVGDGVHVRRHDVRREPSADFRFAAAVAAFGLVLRDSSYKGTASFGLVRALAEGAVNGPSPEHRRDFLALVDKTASLGEKKP